MADQKVNIAIGTSYNGNGMSAALGSVDKLSKTAGKAAGAVGSLGSALGGMGGKAGQAIGAVTKLTGALAMGGPLGIAVAGVTTLIGAFNDYQEKQEAARKATEEHAKKMKQLQEEAAKKAWKDFVDDLARGRTEADSMATALQKVVNLENALAAAKQANVSATQSLAQAELAASTAAKVRAESTPEGKALAQAQGNTAMAQLRGQAGIASAEAKASAVKSTISSLEQTYDAMLGVNDQLERKIQDLQDAWVESHQDLIEEGRLDAGSAGKYKNGNDAEVDAEIIRGLMANDVELQKSLNAVYKEQENVQARIRDEGLKLAALREQEEAAEKGILQARVTAAEEEAAAKDAQMEAENNLAAAKLASEEKIVKLKQQQEIAEANELGRIEWQARLEETKARYSEDMKKLDEEILAAKDDLRRAIKAAEAGFAGGNGGSGGPGYGGGRIRPRTGAAANNEDWGNWGTFAKPENWDVRNAQTHGDPNAPLRKSEQAELNKLDAMAAAGEVMSDKQKARQKELGARDPERQKLKQEQAAAKIERLMQQKKQKEEQMYTDIGEIKNVLSQLKTN